MSYSIKKVAVIGAGVMGSGIAAAIACAGIPVVLLDIVLDKLCEEEKRKGASLDSDAHRNLLARLGKERVSDKKRGLLFTPEMAEYITIGNLETDLEMLEDCDWVVEAVTENLEIKHSLYESLIPYIRKDAIVTSSTSGLSIKSIADNLPSDLRKRFLGAHFLNPPRHVRLLEIIPSVYTCSKVTAFMKRFGYEILGKGVVETKDTPNFIANRIGVASTMILLQLMKKYNFDFETVDYLSGQLIGRPRSATFKTLDMAGLDVLVGAADNLAAVVRDEDEKKLFVLPSYIREMIRDGQLGDKSNGGFYKQKKNCKGDKTMLVWNEKRRGYLPSKAVAIPFVEDVKKKRRLKDRLISLVYSNEPAGHFLWEYISALLLYCSGKASEMTNSYTEIDNAMRWGFDWEVGPFELWDLIGLKKSADKMQENGLELPKWINKRLAEYKTFYTSDPDVQSYSKTYDVVCEMEHCVLLDMGDGVLGFEINSPENGITADLRRELVEAVNLLDDDNCYVGMVLLDKNINFLCSIDLKYALKIIANKDYKAIEAASEDFQRVCLRLKYAKKPIVAAIHGPVLGGSLEYVIHASRIVAHVETCMGFVEASVGFLPVGGGVKELLTRAASEISVYDYSDFNPALHKYWKNMVASTISKNAFHARKMGYLQPTDKIVAQIDLLPQRAKEEVLTMVKEGYRQKVPFKVKVSGTSGYAYLESAVNTMRNDGCISEYDAVIAREIAKVITGGDVPKDTLLSETELLKLERKGFVNLCHYDKTLERFKAMVETGRALRN